MTRGYAQRMSALQERSLMARRPYLEILQYLKQADLKDADNIKFVLWGKFGTGKSVTLCQLTHFAVKVTGTNIMTQLNDNLFSHFPVKLHSVKLS